jgi:O-antigen/teichoic acid export membrane protein
MATVSEAVHASAARFAAVFGSAMALGQLSQLLWLSAGSRTMTLDDFGTVLAAQALYALLQYVVDNGPAFYGARLAATGRLDDVSRGPLVRLRLQLAGIAAALALGLAAVGGSELLVAVAPFALALVLFALFPYWEHFGLGESGPWSAYVILRSAGPALVAVAFLAASAGFPLFLAGVVECVVIVLLVVAFRLRAVQSLRLALSAGRGPLRESMTIGFPTIVSQIGLASGTVLLAVSGAAAAAAALAVGVRLLTGLNQLSGLLVTSLFPQLAREAPSEESEEERRAAVTLSMEVVLVLTALATAVLLIDPGFLVTIFLSESTTEAEATAVLVIASSAAVGYLLVVTTVLIARHREAATLQAFSAGTAIVVAGGLAVIAIDPDWPAFAMAGAFASGQLASVIVLAKRADVLLPDLAATSRRGALGAFALIGIGAVAAAVEETRWPFAVVLALVAAVLLASVSSRVRAFAVRRP